MFPFLFILNIILILIYFVKILPHTKCVNYNEKPNTIIVYTYINILSPFIVIVLIYNITTIIFSVIHVISISDTLFGHGYKNKQNHETFNTCMYVAEAWQVQSETIIYSLYFFVYNIIL